MFNNRRALLKTSIALGVYSAGTATGLIAPAITQAEWIANFFSPGTLNESVKKSFNIPDITTIDSTDKIELKLPSIAENGAVVPIGITINLEMVEQVFIFVEKNPIPLTAVFNLSPNVEASVSTRLKMAETSDVIVIAKAEGKLYKTQQMVKVTVGGCGG
jgi:sulfur-oxidizing protein SoxY